MKILDRANEFLISSQMTQQELAVAIGVHSVSLNRVLHGKSGKETVIQKLDAFLDAQNFYPEGSSASTPPAERRNGGTPA